MFSYPEGHLGWQARKSWWRGASLSPPVRQAALLQCVTFTDTVQLNASLMQLTKAEQKEAAGSARRLFQNHRLPDRTFRDILLDVWKCLPCLKIVICLLLDFSRSLGWVTLVCMRRLFRQHCTSWVLDICGHRSSSSAGLSETASCSCHTLHHIGWVSWLA
jgi:hypothetical protein